jgi:hypothetical protein
VREVSQSPDAELWPVTTPVVVETYPDGADQPAVRERVEPEVVIRFDYLVLVRAAGDPDWYMGQVHDGEVVCWGGYGPDLEAAIRAL